MADLNYAVSQLAKHGYSAVAFELIDLKIQTTYEQI